MLKRDVGCGLPPWLVMTDMHVAGFYATQSDDVRIVTINFGEVEAVTGRASMEHLLEVASQVAFLLATCVGSVVGMPPEPHGSPRSPYHFSHGDRSLTGFATQHDQRYQDNTI